MKAFILILITALTLPAIGEHNRFDYVMERTITFTRTPHESFWWHDIDTLRVNLDLSLDSGSNWTQRIAHGLVAREGVNSYVWSLRVTPDLWTEHARVAVRTLWSSTGSEMIMHDGHMSDSDFAIAGVRILTPEPGTQLLNPGYHELRWHEAGPDSVDIGVSTNGIDFDLVANVASLSATNSYMLPVVDLPNGPLWICVQAYTDLYDIVQCQLISH